MFVYLLLALLVVSETNIAHSVRYAKENRLAAAAAAVVFVCGLFLLLLLVSVFFF